MALHRITATHIIRSPVSGKVMEKIGMKKEGVLREHVIKWDKYEDVVSYGILRKEWEACTWLTWLSPKSLIIPLWLVGLPSIRTLNSSCINISVPTFSLSCKLANLWIWTIFYIVLLSGNLSWSNSWASSKSNTWFSWFLNPSWVEGGFCRYSDLALL